MDLETGKQLLGKGVLAGLPEKTGRGQDSDGDTVTFRPCRASHHTRPIVLTDPSGDSPILGKQALYLNSFRSLRER